MKPRNMDKIVISGMGIISAIGNNCMETLDALKASKSGIDTIHYLNTSHTEFPVGEVKLTNEEMISMLGLTASSVSTRTSLMGMIAVREAIETAGIYNINQRCSIISGTTVGGMDKSEQYYLEFLENDLHKEYIKTHDCGACTEMIADYFGFFSQVDTISTACSSAANAILLGAKFLQSGKTDVAVAGGAECITRFHLNGFNTLRILDCQHCRPFDNTRAGLNLGEGAAYIVMETEKHFLERTALTPPESQRKIYAYLSGAANTCDAFHQTASSPDGKGAYMAMKNALHNAGLHPSNVDYINAHGTGTANNDLSEGYAIEKLFGNNIPPVSSTKAFTGHTTSAAGGIEAVISILSMNNSLIPVNLNFKEKMPELSFKPVTEYSSNDIHLEHVLSNSFGFGGNDTTLIFSHHKRS
ncbi:MAG: beta-ketoacyl-[acyl-carrier-protein] synthase family protein [Dysgonamonadaceae bacterium]|jgi:3-oxoacyl-[acyl-carrier-protein] synthase-1|nr:beta-ketoacyl-[acyl-carrier-protein] synthase family protein [Dysgonamonadaceae bacterium]